MSVLVIILTFALFIALDFLVQARRSAKRAHAHPPALEPVTAAPGSLEPVWVAGYQLPDELHYHRGHTWTRVLDPRTVLVGLDDFARKLVGPAMKVVAPSVGSRLHQGSAGFRVQVDGKAADFLSPVDGTVVDVNPDLRGDPSLADKEPYGRGWILKVRPSDLSRNLHNLLSGSLARRWVEDSRERLEFQLMSLSGSVLQDGGEPVADFARHLPDEEWRRLVGEFLLT